MSAAAEPGDGPVLAGRICGTCTLCCKVFPVAELAKPAGRWCVNVKQGQGCAIYAERPGSCRDFFCQWRYSADLGPEWKPEIARFVLSIYPGSNALAVSVDPGSPTAWRAEPYLSSLKRWAGAALAEGNPVLVFTGERATAILPDREIELGVLAPGDRVSVLRGPSGFDVRRVPAGAAHG